ncbi:MAG: type II toxin-antitoxin system VapC family toxin [Anaerolineales bacterium]|nr:type II toxin-antitoxin system VapC family toxin [Anaerolineales bacterium]
MPNYILIDTDILIDVGRNVETAVSYLENIQSHSHLAISAITQMELIIGCRNKTELQELEQFLRRFALLHMNESISAQATTLLQQYRLSHGLLIADALIAATAIIHNLPFVSKNQRDYRFIANLDLLRYPA